ncbi:hypothetical protein OOOCML_32855 (plasmid) [Cupriavidus necator H16]
MGKPAEVLQAFWQELRGRTRVTIDHPDLPETLRDIAAGGGADHLAGGQRGSHHRVGHAARQTIEWGQATLAAERQAHAATQARLEPGRAELDAAGRELATAYAILDRA